MELREDDEDERRDGDENTQAPVEKLIVGVCPIVGARNTNGAGVVVVVAVVAVATRCVIDGCCCSVDMNDRLHLPCSALDIFFIFVLISFLFKTNLLFPLL